MECKEPILAAGRGWGPRWKPSEWPWRFTCRAVFQTEEGQRRGVCRGLWPPSSGARGGRKQKMGLEEVWGQAVGC